jgi:DNA-binding GntR family transcriptional regulator
LTALSGRAVNPKPTTDRGAHRLDPIAVESTSSIIARTLREAIANGVLVAGEQLTEAGLAQDLGVSRGPMREAMQRLAQEGLLTSIRHRGLFVMELTRVDVEDIYLVRTAVERAAGLLLIDRGEPEDILELRGLLRAMQQASDHGDSAALGKADIAFHEGFVALSRSTRLQRTHATLVTETRVCMGVLNQAYPDHDDRLGEHARIVEAIANGDANTMDRLLSEHARDALDRLLPRFPEPKI